MNWWSLVSITLCLYSVSLLLVLVRDDYRCRDCQWSRSCRYRQRERGIMIECWPWLCRSFLWQGCSNGYRKISCWFACSQEEISTHPFDWRTKNQLSGVQFHNGLLSRNSVKISLDEIEKVKFHSEWGKSVFTTWFVTVVTVILNNVPKKLSSNLLCRRWNTNHDGWNHRTWVAQTSLKSMVHYSGSVKRKTSCQKDLRIQVHQMANLQKKQISWTSGLTRFIMEWGYAVPTVLNPNIQRILPRRFRPIPWLAQLIFLSHLWRTMVLHHTNKFLSQGLFLMGKVRRCLNFWKYHCSKWCWKAIWCWNLAFWVTSVDSCNDVLSQWISEPSVWDSTRSEYSSFLDSSNTSDF